MSIESMNEIENIARKCIDMIENENKPIIYRMINRQNFAVTSLNEEMKTEEKKGMTPEDIRNRLSTVNESRSNIEKLEKELENTLCS